MNILVLILMSTLGVVCLGIPLAAVATVYRDELMGVWPRVRSALAFDPRHAALDYHFAR